MVMVKSRRISLITTLAASGLLALSATTGLAQESSSDGSDVEMVKVWSVDYSGRPPFKRQLIELPAADVAAMEAENQIIETERVWTAKFSGKPPFKRRYYDVPVIDAASLETAETEEASGRKKPLGTFKRHR